MKTLVRLAVAATLLSSGAAIAPAFADTALPSLGNGEAVLYIRNTTNDTVYVRGLGQNLDSLLTQSQIASSGYSSNPIVESGGLATLQHDATLTNFLNGVDPSKIEWAVLGGDSQAASASASIKNSGELRYLTTTQQVLTGVPNVTNNNLKTSFGNLETTVQSGANGAINSGVADDKGSGVGGAIWSPTNLGSQDWSGLLNNVSSGFSTANLYMLATNGLASGTGGGNTTQAEVYQFASLTLQSNGDLVGVEVPLPAAVWLFGSGLLGLAGIGRRRAPGAVVAA